jgi:hypothetical protein
MHVRVLALAVLSLAVAACATPRGPREPIIAGIPMVPPTRVPPPGATPGARHAFIRNVPPAGVTVLNENPANHLAGLVVHTTTSAATVRLTTARPSGGDALSAYPVVFEAFVAPGTTQQWDFPDVQVPEGLRVQVVSGSADATLFVRFFEEY